MGQKSSRRRPHPYGAESDVASALAPDKRNPSRGKHPEPQERVHAPFRRVVNRQR